MTQAYANPPPSKTTKIAAAVRSAVVPGLPLLRASRSPRSMSSMARRPASDRTPPAASTWRARAVTSAARPAPLRRAMCVSGIGREHRQKRLHNRIVPRQGRRGAPARAPAHPVRTSRRTRWRTRMRSCPCARPVASPRPASSSARWTRPVTQRDRVRPVAPIGSPRMPPAHPRPWSPRAPASPRSRVRPSGLASGPDPRGRGASQRREQEHDAEIGVRARQPRSGFDRQP